MQKSKFDASLFLEVDQVEKKPGNTPLKSFACFFQAFVAQLIAEIHSSYLTDSGKQEGSAE